MLLCWQWGWLSAAIPDNESTVVAQQCKVMQGVKSGRTPQRSSASVIEITLALGI